MKLIAIICAFFGIRKRGGVAAVDEFLPAHQSFSDAMEALSTAFDRVLKHANLANRRYTILIAECDLNKAPPLDTRAAVAYDRAVAAFSDPADFKPYTEAELDAHTVAMICASEAFDDVCVAFAALNPAGTVYAAAARVFKANCDLFAETANAYAHAALCALTSALKGNLQAAKDEVEVGRLELLAGNPRVMDPVGAKANAETFRNQTLENAALARVLEKKAKLAESQADVFINQAKIAQTKAEDALHIAGEACD